MEKQLTTKILTLRPANLQDKKSIYMWLAHSNLTDEMLGAPNFPEVPIPTWEEFNEDYKAHYFDGSHPLKGQCFIITYNGNKIGQINHNEIDPITQSTEIDIWLADRVLTGKGYGTGAIKLLSEYLVQYFECKTIYIAPSKRNLKAIRAYIKAGFKETKEHLENFVPDYEDAIVMVKRLL
ncbi:GNAT family N-acetyltransferase [uncultured Cyclobacterium sp.]|uniref:GNAT family N-acetyltransferase n=1 Tax=uncultured Cyclobacterium sp. TaxID=453820 RepID=UPI0030EF6FEB|tara:strand:+ start:821 stop:1360 length:540 start_codon:yes stop_codon:yes gene_type:complete